MAIRGRVRAASPKVVDLGGVAPNATPKDAHESLMLRLRELARLSHKSQERAAYLETYRIAALQAKYQPPPRSESPYTDDLFPYVHNEFLFNSARKVGPLAQVTHLVFAPAYVDRFQAAHRRVVPREFVRDPLKALDKGTHDTLNWIWQRAIHELRPESKSRDGKVDLRGGKDDIFEKVRDVPDFSEPYATPKRYVVDIKEEALTLSSGEARRETEEYDRYFQRSGYSNILANTVEFFWRATKWRKGHFRWARHDTPYQTFTFTNEYARTVDEREPPVPLGSEAWTEVILAAIARNPDDDRNNYPFDHNALKDLNFNVFGKVVGRYIHGLNLLVLPLKFFLDCEVSQPYSGTPSTATLLDLLADLSSKASLAPETIAAWRDWARRPDVRGLWDPEFRALLRRLQEDDAVTLRFDSLVVGATRHFLLAHCLLVDPSDGFDIEHAGSDRFDSEFVGYKCMGGRAYVFTDIRNRPHKKQAEHDGLFSRTLIIDCGLNEYERGRLIQTITEFGSERVLSLQWLARFRMVHHALNVIQTRISLAFSYYQANQKQQRETLPDHYLIRVQRRSDVRGAAGLLNALEFLSSCLSVLNDVIEGGIIDRSHAARSAQDAILRKLHSLREEPLRGFQSLSEYLERRYARPLRTIQRAGERYEVLRRRITEIAELVNVRMQREMNRHQHDGIRLGGFLAILAMSLALLALPHPLGTWTESFGKGDIYFRWAICASLAIGGLYVVLYLLYELTIWTARWLRGRRP